MFSDAGSLFQFLAAQTTDVFLLAGKVCPHGAYRAIIVEAEVTAVLLALRLSARQRLAYPAIEALFQRCAHSVFFVYSLPFL